VRRLVQCLLGIAPLEKRWRAADEAAVERVNVVVEAYQCLEAARSLGSQHWVFAVLADTPEQKPASGAVSAYDRLRCLETERLEQALRDCEQHLRSMKDALMAADALVQELNEQLTRLSFDVIHAAIVAVSKHLSWDECFLWRCVSDLEVLVRQMAQETSHRRYLWEILRRSCYSGRVPSHWWQRACSQLSTGMTNDEHLRTFDSTITSEWSTVKLEPLHVLDCWAYSVRCEGEIVRERWRPRYHSLAQSGWQEWIDKLLILNVTLDQLAAQAGTSDSPARFRDRV
jgi:hypothetical protein